MKKILFVILALLLTYGVAQATNIPMVVDPKNYPTVWTELVYNGSGSNIATGLVVMWDFVTSDSDASAVYDDMCPWVKLATGDGPMTAGVTTIAREVGASTNIAISNGNVGRIIIHGPAVVHRTTQGTAVTLETFVSGDSSGGVVDETCDAVDEDIVGTVIAISAAANDVEADIGSGSSLIYVDPTPYKR